MIPAQQGIAETIEKIARGNERYERIGLNQAGKIHGCLQNGIEGTIDNGRLFLQYTHFYGLPQRCLCLVDESHEICSLLHPQLTAQQIHSLDAVCSLINRVDFLIPHELFHRIFPAVTITAVGLNGQVVDNQSHFRAIRFHNRCKDFNHRLPFIGFHFISGRFPAIHHVVAIQTKHSDAFDDGFLFKKHPADIGVLNDRYSHGRIFQHDIGTLDTVFGIS